MSKQSRIDSLEAQLLAVVVELKSYQEHGVDTCGYKKFVEENRVLGDRNKELNRRLASALSVADQRAATAASLLADVERLEQEAQVAYVLEKLVDRVCPKEEEVLHDE